MANEEDNVIVITSEESFLKAYKSKYACKRSLGIKYNTKHNEFKFEDVKSATKLYAELKPIVSSMETKLQVMKEVLQKVASNGKDEYNKDIQAKIDALQKLKMEQKIN